MTRILQDIFAGKVRGLSYAGNSLTQDYPYSRVMQNVYMDYFDQIQKRNGFGIWSHYGNLRGLKTEINVGPGTPAVEETFCWANDPDDSDLIKLHKLNNSAILTISNSTGATLLFKFLSTGTEWQATLQTLSGGSFVDVSGWPKTYGTGIESSPTDLADLQSDLDAETGISASLTGGTTQVPAAALEFVRQGLIVNGGSVEYEFGSWDEIQTAPTQSGSTYTQDYTTATYTDPYCATVNKVNYWVRDQQGQTVDELSTSSGRQPLYKYDGLRCYRAGLPTLALASVADGTTAAGLDAGSIYTYKTRLKRTDYRGNTVFGEIITNTAHTIGGSNVSELDLTFDTMTSGDRDEFMVRFAIVNGNQTASTITVDSGHTIQAGDTVWLLNSGTLESYSVTGTTSTTITIGSSVTVADNSILSNITVEIWRNISEGTSWYFVAELPFDSDNGLAYEDATTDANLVTNDELVEPLIVRSEPPPGRFIVAHQGLLVVSGVPSREHEVFVSDITSAEYFPTTNIIDVATSGSGPITGLGSDGERLYIFKHRSYVIVHGNLRVVNPGQPPDIYVEERLAGIGCPAHGTIVPGVSPKGAESLYFTSYEGPQRLISGQLDVEFAGRLHGYFEGRSESSNTGVQVDYPSSAFNSRYVYKNAKAVYDPNRKYYIVSFSLESGSVDSYLHSAASSQWFVYEEPKAEGLGDRWYKWDTGDPSGGGFGVFGAHGGMAISNSMLLVAGRHNYSGTSSHGYIAKERGPASGGQEERFSDNIQAINARYGTPWMHFGNPSVKKLLSAIRVRRIRHWGEIEIFDDGDVDVDIYVDFSNFNSLIAGSSRFTLTFASGQYSALNDVTLDSFEAVLLAFKNFNLYEGLTITGIELGFRAEFEGGELEEP